MKKKNLILVFYSLAKTEDKCESDGDSTSEGEGGSDSESEGEICPKIEFSRIKNCFDGSITNKYWKLTSGSRSCRN